MKKKTWRKITILADVLLGISLVAFGALALFLVVAALGGDYLDNIAPWFFLFGVATYISNLLVRGYGEIVRNSEDVCNTVALISDQLAQILKDKQDADVCVCEVCKTRQKQSNKFCCNCGIVMNAPEEK